MANKGFTYNEQGELVEIPMTPEEEAELIQWQADLAADLTDYKQGIDTKVQTLIDTECQKYRYDNILQVNQFAAVENGFQSEAIALLDWNARVWELTEAHIAEVSQIPDFDFIETLPAFEYVIPPTVGVLNVATFENGQRSFNTPYKVSETRPANISVSVSISCVLSVSGGQSAKVELQISPDGITWTSKAECKNTATGTIQVGTQTNNITQTLQTDIPKNWYWRLKKTNLLSAPACAIEGGTETLY